MLILCSDIILKRNPVTLQKWCSNSGLLCKFKSVWLDTLSIQELQTGSQLGPSPTRGGCCTHNPTQSLKNLLHSELAQWPQELSPTYHQGFCLFQGNRDFSLVSEHLYQYYYLNKYFISYSSRFETKRNYHVWVHPVFDKGTWHLSSQSNTNQTFE